MIYGIKTVALPAREVYVHEDSRLTSLRIAVDSAAFSRSEAMKTSWYVPAGKHML